MSQEHYLILFPYTIRRGEKKEEEEEQPLNLMEFLPFRSCCAGASVNPAAESAASPRPVKRAGNGQASGGRPAKVKSAKWKPSLSVITEDGVVAEIGSKQQNKGTVRSQKKASDRATPRGRGDNASYWFRGRLQSLDNNLFKWRKVAIQIEPPASATELSERYAHIYL